MKRVALTTEDNPFNPLTDFENWFAFDEQNGYHTSEYLARIAKTSLEMSERDYWNAIEEAIDEILSFNLTGNYKKVVEKSNPP